MDERPAAPERILHSIQILRALAAWAIVVQHYYLIFPIASPSWWRQGFMDHGAVGVDVFFIVSGFVMALGASDPEITPRQFVAKRLGRIVPAYWLYTMIVAALIYYLPEAMPNQGVSPEFLVKSLLFIPAQNPSGIGLLPVNTVGWTLNLEMVFYLIVAISLFVALPRRWLWIVVGLAIWQMVLAPLGIISPLYISPLPYEFAMGIGAFHLWKSGVLRGPSWAFAVLAGVALWMLSRAPLVEPMRVITCGVPALLLVCACIGLEPHIKRASILGRLGDHSYSVYLVHPAILYLGAFGWKQTHIKHVFPILCMISIALIGWASYRFIERPLGRLLTRLIARRRPA